MKHLPKPRSAPNKPARSRSKFCLLSFPYVDAVLEQRVETLEKELDAAISAAARARTEKRHAESAQKAAELRAVEITKELENTSKVFELHMEELRVKQHEISKRDKEIKLLEAIIKTLGGRESLNTGS
ncbi:uncharacterized protein LOC131018315 isoform X2 [Salvia miltiorrhiza]|uniref:uncharacterized protein LOC131018315 isoform X2 n=1 Tax=Salvia miltiorrhiza TaxID=226208 RepID=UPI0025ABB35B|nr:uncharacterized protein LOC131018315 isoform X2 [Salvia miltiorrhiza]